MIQGTWVLMYHTNCITVYHCVNVFGHFVWSITESNDKYSRQCYDALMYWNTEHFNVNNIISILQIEYQHLIYSIDQ